VGVDLSREEHVLGTADYVAPEQTVDSSRVDHRADLYSLGCTLYFLLSGHAPFPTGSAQERITAHQRQMPPSLLSERPDAPQALVHLCERMMEKAPSKRPQTAADVQSTLRTWLASEVATGRVGKRSVAAAATSSEARESDAGGSGSSLLFRSGASLTDTDSNLHRATDRIPPPIAAELTGSAASQSHVFGTDLARYGGASNTPLPPPLVAPPPRAPSDALQPAAVGPQAMSGNVPAVGVSLSASGPTRSVPRPSTRSAGARMLGTFLLTALILGALLFALFALGR
jgi:serine/threonine protein kinase